MALVFTPSTQMASRAPLIGLRGASILVGTITVSGSYAAGGDTFTTGQTIEDVAKRLGAGKILAALADMRGVTPEWDATAKKLKFFTGASVELAAAAYPAAMSATPIPVAFLVI